MPERQPLLIRTAGEFVLIVVGVLAAFAVEASWAGVQDRRAEAEYVRDLRDESDRNAQALDALIATSGAVEADLLRALALAEADLVRDSAEVFILALAQGGNFFTLPRITRSVFDDLSSSGRLQLIRTPALRRGIMDHYARLDVGLGRLAGVQQEVGSELASLVAASLSPGIVIRTPGGRATGWTIAADVPRTTVQEAALVLARHPQLISSIRSEVTVLERERFILIGTRGEIERHTELLSEPSG